MYMISLKSGSVETLSCPKEREIKSDHLLGPLLKVVAKKGKLKGQKVDSLWATESWFRNGHLPKNTFTTNIIPLKKTTWQPRN